MNKYNRYEEEVDRKVREWERKIFHYMWTIFLSIATSIIVG